MSDTVIKLPDLSLRFDLPGDRHWHLREPLGLIFAADRVQARVQEQGEPDDYSVLHLLPQAVAEFGAPADLTAAELQAVLDHAMAERLRRQQAHTDELERLLRDLQGREAAPASAPWLLQQSRRPDPADQGVQDARTDQDSV